MSADLAHLAAVLDHVAERLAAASDTEYRDEPHGGDGLTLSLAAGEARLAAFFLRGALG